MKILGIDYGRKKIGVAVGDTKTKLAEPKQVLSISNFKFQISNLIQENEIDKIIVGLPGGRLDQKISEFGKNIETQTNLPVEYFDETLTTKDAQRILIESGRGRKKRKEREDATAAAIMLELYLDRLR